MKKKMLFPLFASLITMVFVSCNKEGSEGPPGPEGPSGNNGSNGGSSSGEVKAYQTVPGTTFTWVSLVDNKYQLLPTSAGGIPYPEGVQFIDTSGTAGNALILPFLRVTTGNTDTAWVALPHLVRSRDSTNMDRYQAGLDIYPETNGTHVVVQVSASLVGNVGPTALTPYLKAAGIRLICIPANPGGTLGRYQSPEGLGMEEVMRRYQLTEADFINME